MAEGCDTHRGPRTAGREVGVFSGHDSDADNFDEFLKRLEVVGIAGVQRYPCCACSGGDE